MSKKTISHAIALAGLMLAFSITVCGQTKYDHSHYVTGRNLVTVRWSKSRRITVQGGTVWMHDRLGRTIWTYSTEPNKILDIAVGPRGLIYLTIFDGLVEILNPRGKRIWSHFMNGSANYSQIAPFRGGFLVVLDTEAYREKGLDTKDFLEFWKHGQRVWLKDFPAHARLRIERNRISAEVADSKGPTSTIISPQCTPTDPICAGPE